MTLVFITSTLERCSLISVCPPKSIGAQLKTIDPYLYGIGEGAGNKVRPIQYRPGMIQGRIGAHWRGPRRIGSGA